MQMKHLNTSERDSTVGSSCGDVDSCSIRFVLFVVGLICIPIPAICRDTELSEEGIDTSPLATFSEIKDRIVSKPKSTVFEFDETFSRSINLISVRMKNKISSKNSCYCITFIF